MSVDDELERRLAIAAEQEAGARRPRRLTPTGTLQALLAEREELLADEQLQLEADAEREAEEARETEPADVELGLRSIWDVPR